MDDCCLPEPDPIHAHKRRTARRALVPEEAACALCGTADPNVLEDDHVLGVAGSDDVRAWVCKNCHARQTALRHDLQAGTPAGRHQPDLSLLERLARTLRSLAVFAHTLSQALFTYAQQLLDLARGLDEHAPGWRLEPWSA